MAIVVNNLNGSKVDVREDDNGNTIINITSNEVVTVGSIREAVKESWGKLANPNSHESKMLNRSARLSRRE